ncbi:unnamed protein product [Periconia digitata]|uniref:Uncharacterized protein n=1 Tax=Periconia digitata TaxID=1303443 RepID=A0A9W4XMB0_9PLEO|nr:unnamed protein product [Periconia digitata]
MIGCPFPTFEHSVFYVASYGASLNSISRYAAVLPGLKNFYNSTTHPSPPNNKRTSSQSPHASSMFSTYTMKIQTLVLAVLSIASTISAAPISNLTAVEPTSNESLMRRNAPHPPGDTLVEIDKMWGMPCARKCWHEIFPEIEKWRQDVYCHPDLTWAYHKYHRRVVPCIKKNCDWKREADLFQYDFSVRFCKFCGWIPKGAGIPCETLKWHEDGDAMN